MEPEQRSNFAAPIPWSRPGRQFPASGSTRPQLPARIDTVEKAHGRPLILYLLPEFEAKYQVRQAFVREIWLRNLATRPSHPNWRIWQYTPIGRISRIQGGVDLNLMKY